MEMKLINYFDVWGNKRDGWEVNNLCSEGNIEVPEELTDKQVLTALKDVGFLKNHVRTNMLTFDYLPDFGVEIRQKKDDQPICRIEYINE
jgi:hypothetical protein